MFNKTGFIISLTGLAILMIPERAAPAPEPEISATLAIRDAPKGEGKATAQAPAANPAEPGPDTRPEAIRNLRITREINVTRWLEPGEFSWDAAAAAAAGPIGNGHPATVIVNLRSRTLSVYRNGIELGRAHILYGYGAHPTPTGTFPVKLKKLYHESRTYNNAPMPFMLRLTDDGVALHGSANHADDLATHGCIGMPPEFAPLLYEHVGVGDPVVIWSGRTDS